MIEYFEEIGKGLVDFLIINFVRLALNPKVRFILKKLVLRSKSTQTIESIIQTTVENLDILLDSNSAVDIMKDMVKTFPIANTRRLIYSFKGKVFKMSQSLSSMPLLMVLIEKEPKTISKFFIQEIIIENKIKWLLKNRSFYCVLRKMTEYLSNPRDINLIICQIRKEISDRKNDLALYSKNGKDQDFKESTHLFQQSLHEDLLYIKKCESVLMHITERFNIY